MLQFGKFVATRAIMALITLIIVSLIVFSLMELVPGDCAERYLAFKNTQGSGISMADIENERIRLGLDKPFLQRWSVWIVGAFQGDFGDSCILRVNIAQLMGDKFWISLALCVASLALAYLIAVPVGIIAAATSNPWLNNGLRIFSYLGLALPNFLLALMIMLFATVYFGDTLTGLFSPEYRDAALELGQGSGPAEPCLAAHLHPWLVGHGLCAANGARTDVRRDRQALRHRRRRARRFMGANCCGGIPRGTRWGPSSTASASISTASSTNCPSWR